MQNAINGFWNSRSPFISILFMSIAQLSIFIILSDWLSARARAKAAKFNGESLQLLISSTVMAQVFSHSILAVATTFIFLSVTSSCYIIMRPFSIRFLIPGWRLHNSVTLAASRIALRRLNASYSANYSAELNPIALRISLISSPNTLFAK